MHARTLSFCCSRVHPQEANTSSSSSSSSGGSSRSDPSKGQPAAAAAGSKPPPSAQQVADLLYNQWLLDVPKMMDLAVLYGPGSSSLTGQLLQALLLLQPKYAQVGRLVLWLVCLWWLGGDARCSNW
jgi:hypothetical protein